MENKSRDIELEKQIDAYVKGQLSEQQAHDMWVKLLQRPDYIDLLETELAVRSLVEQGAVEVEEEEDKTSEAPVHWLSGTRKWIAAAAAVLLIIAGVNFFSMDSEPDLQEMAMSEITLSDNLITPNVTRSQEAALGTADSLMNEGFRAAISGDVDEAIEIYNTILEKYGESAQVAEAHLNIGIIKYNSGNFEEAITEFNDVLESDKTERLIREKAYWYKGNAMVNLDRLDEAREAIHNAYGMDGIYRKPAYRLLQKIDYKLGNIDYEDSEVPLDDAQE